MAATGLALLLIASLGEAARGDPASEPVRIAGVEYLGDLPTLVAAERGLFARAGIDARVTFGQSGKANLEALRAGRLDFALMALTPLVLDRLADPTPGEADDPVILTSLLYSSRFNYTVTLEGSGIEAPGDLAGRRVGLTRGTNAEFAWWLFTLLHGLEGERLSIIDLPPSELGPALLDQRVEAAVMWQPWVARLEGGAADRIATPWGPGTYAARWVLVTTGRNASERAGTSRALIRAYREAIAAIDREPDEALALFARAHDVPPAHLRRRWDALDYQVTLDWALVTNLRQQFAWARDAGYGRGRGDLLSLFAPGPLRAVDPELVGIPGAHAAVPDPSP